MPQGPRNTRFYIQLDEYGRQLIMESLERNKGCMAEVSRDLGINRTDLYMKMKKYGIPVGTKRGPRVKMEAPTMSPELRRFLGMRAPSMKE